MNKRQIKRRAKKVANLKLSPDARERHIIALMYEAIQSTLDDVSLVVALTKLDRKELYSLLQSAALNPDLLDREAKAVHQELIEDVKKELERLETPVSDAVN